MKNIHILATGGKSRLYEFGGQIILTSEPTDSFRNQDIYITNDEEIKEGNWVYYENGDLKGIHKVVNGQRPKTMILRKIILTTDQDLIKDGIKSIDDDFLEWFVKNPSCEFVEVIPLRKSSGWYDEKEVWHWDFLAYKIIIPKEEPTMVDKLKDYLNNTPEEQIQKDWDEAVKKTEGVNSPTVEEFLGAQFNLKDGIEESIPHKKETPEEAARIRHLELLTGEIGIIPNFLDGFREGVDWQAKRSYTEEEVYEKLHNLMTDIKLQGVVINDDIDLKKWFEENKKK